MSDTNERLGHIYRRIEAVVDASGAYALTDILPHLSWRHKGDFVVNVIFVILFIKRHFSSSHLLDLFLQLYHGC